MSINNSLKSYKLKPYIIGKHNNIYLTDPRKVKVHLASLKSIVKQVALAGGNIYSTFKFNYYPVEKSYAYDNKPEVHVADMEYPTACYNQASVILPEVGINTVEEIVNLGLDEAKQAEKEEFMRIYMHMIKQNLDV